MTIGTSRLGNTLTIARIGGLIAHSSYRHLTPGIAASRTGGPWCSNLSPAAACLGGGAPVGAGCGQEPAGGGPEEAPASGPSALAFTRSAMRVGNCARRAPAAPAGHSARPQRRRKGEKTARIGPQIEHRGPARPKKNSLRDPSAGLYSCTVHRFRQSGQPK